MSAKKKTPAATAKKKASAAKTKAPAKKQAPATSQKTAKKTPRPVNPAAIGSGLFLVKSEPSTYSFARLVAEKKTRWDGVRNFEARNNLRAMKVGDLCLFYHSSLGKEIVGVAKVAKAAYADPTATEGDWSAVDLAPAFPLAEPVSLDVIKSTPAFADMQILTRPRLSVTPVTRAEFDALLKLAKTRTPAH